MAPTNLVVEMLNETITERLTRAGRLHPHDRIEIGGRVLYPGQPVVTRANDRKLTYGLDGEEWVRNGDRWTVNAGTRDELYVTNIDNGHRHAIPADYVAAGKVTVDYASTINRAQGATVDEAHLIIDDRTNSKQLYVGTTRGRRANHIHTAPPAFDLEQHGPHTRPTGWTPADAVSASLDRHPDEVSALARRRQLRELSTQERDPKSGHEADDASVNDHPRDSETERVAAAMRRLERFTRRPSRGLEL